MPFSQIAAMHIVPLMARLVLAAAFITTGWGKLFGSDITFVDRNAQVLIDLGIAKTPPSTSPIKQASFQPDEPPSDASGENQAASPQAGAAQSPQLTVQAKPLHVVTVTLVKINWPWRPELIAWTAAITELVGGALLLLGLFSRLWGIGLAVSKLSAIVLSTWPLVIQHQLFELPSGDFNRLFKQLGLLVLALTIAMVGPGAVSLDRILFRREPALPPPRPRPVPTSPAVIAAAEKRVL